MTLRKLKCRFDSYWEHKRQKNILPSQDFFAFVLAAAMFREYTKLRGGTASHLSDGENELVVTKGSPYFLSDDEKIIPDHKNFMCDRFLPHPLHYQSKHVFIHIPDFLVLFLER